MTLGAFDQRVNGGKLPRYPDMGSMPRAVVNEGLMQELAPGPNYRFGGMVTYEKPIVEFPGDFVVGSSATVIMLQGQDLPRNCVGLRFISLIPGVWASINGYPFRTVLNNDNFMGCEIRSVQIVTDAAGSCIVQSVGTGD